MTNLAALVQVRRQIPGRALFIDPKGTLYISRCYEIYRSEDGGATWRLDCSIPQILIKSALTRIPLAERLLRYNITLLQLMEDGARIAVAREGIYRAEPGETEMKLTFPIKRGSRPLNICLDGQRVLFGEYGDIYKNLEVFVYVSEDGGRTFEVAYTFPRGGIRHVHNIVLDPYSNHYWVLVGDYGEQAGVGAFSKDLKTMEWLRRGDPEFRVVGAIVKPDCLLYGTDSDLSRNFILRLDKQTAKVSKLLEVEGSSLYATSFGPIMAISTCVEPNPCCPSKECAIYLSRDGDSWRRIMPHRKDWFHHNLFQYGALVLPYSYSQQPIGMFSGQAVVDAHNLVTLLDFDNQAGKEQ
jgi:hypothetical protein